MHAAMTHGMTNVHDMKKKKYIASYLMTLHHIKNLYINRRAMRRLSDNNCKISLDLRSSIKKEILFVKEDHSLSCFTRRLTFFKRGKHRGIEGIYFSFGFHGLQSRHAKGTYARFVFHLKVFFRSRVYKEGLNDTCVNCIIVDCIIVFFLMTRHLGSAWASGAHVSIEPSFLLTSNLLQ